MLYKSILLAQIDRFSLAFCANHVEEKGGKWASGDALVNQHEL